MLDKNKWSKITGCATVVLMLATGATAQDTRFTNSQYSVAFQPPAGWLPSLLVQYEGPFRQDGGHPSLSLSAVDRLIDIGEEEGNKLADDFVAEFSEGFEDAKILGRRKLLIANMDALQMDLSFKGDEAVMEVRRVFVPVKQENRTFIFALSDSVDHFAESAALGDSAITSLTFMQAGAPATVPSAPAPKSPAYSLLLVLIGLAALALVVGATYLLARKGRPAGS